MNKSFGVEIRGFATASTSLENVGDIRALVKWLDEHRVDDSIAVDFDMSRVWVELADGEGDMIMCGDHFIGNDKFDVILPTHVHREPTVDNVPAFDWMSVDRYGDEMRPE